MFTVVHKCPQFEKGFSQSSAKPLAGWFFAGAFPVRETEKFYDPWEPRMDVTNSEVGFQRSGRLTETVTESNLICWFDANGRMIGGGMISFT
jgi:hypothetical protein